MTFTDAAAEVLRLVGKPLHYKEITAFAIDKNLLSHVGKSPEVTMGSRLAALFRKEGEDVPLVRVRPGVFALKEWEKSGQLKQMLGKTHSGARAAGQAEPVAASAQAPGEPPAPAEDDLDVGAEVQAEDELEQDAAAEAQLRLPEPPGARAAEPFDPRSMRVEEATSVEAPRTPQGPADAGEPAAVLGRVAGAAEASAAASAELDEDGEPPPQRSADEIARAGLAAGANELFEEEDDDDRPILGGPEVGPEREGGRRRRRRRRRSKAGGEAGAAPNGGLPGYTVSPAFPDKHEPGAAEAPAPSAAAAPHPVVLEVAASSLESVALDDFGGRDMADAIAQMLGSFDRAAGPVSLRQIAEAAQRKGRLAGDLQQLQSQVAAAVRADNLRRAASGQRPRFRLTAGRVALTDWLLSPELARLEHEAIAAVDRYREAARKAFVRKLQELPGHAFVEVVLLLLERAGMSRMRAVRRAGVPGNEAHFCALHQTGAAEIQTGIIVRRDGREIGRERVAELRGSLHHYGPATAGWLVTSGQILSGAREEAAASHTSAIALLDGLAVARLCERHEIAVVQARLPICIPDVDLLEALRAS
jgi:hypothetical protein